MWLPTPYPDSTMRMLLLPHLLPTSCSPSHPQSLHFQGRVVIPTTQMQQELLTEFHSSPIGGHSGIQATLARLKACFYWQGMYSDTKQFVANMDFITHLPPSFGHSTVWVVCDRLSKSVHFIGLPHHYTATDLARRFAVEIFRLHGTPKSIISDRDPIFMSSFWKELFKLRCFAGENPRTWFRFLHIAEYWFNTTHHSAIGMSPFQALYGRPPPSLLSQKRGHFRTGSVGLASTSSIPSALSPA